MSNERNVPSDVNRVVRSWLREDRHEDADRVLGAALDQVDTTPQRQSSRLARREFPMNKFVAIGLGAAAVVVALFIGAQLFGQPNIVGPPTETPASSATPAASEPAAEPQDFGAVTPAALDAGDYYFSHIPGLEIHFTVPGPFAWERNEPDWIVWSYDDVKATMAVSTVDNVYIDPCQPELGLQSPAVGPTVDDLATALGAVVRGPTFTAPADVTQDGHAGVRLDYVSNNCPASMGSWNLLSVNGGTDTLPTPDGDDAASFYIYDVDGTRVVITAAYTESRAEQLDAILDSIRFE
ncbi:MAG TPA: hypothetical protein VJ839_02670 [Candidatus Limnocylindria bacterium]|nr:hypothetical protein [Candidatus Limnocylindria bacterium]